MTNRKLTQTDQLLSKVDRSIKTLTNGANKAARDPYQTANSADLNKEQHQHIAGLMRINHTGEVCAQALYQGQALTAKNQTIRKAMQHAADEEIDHLVWCEDRLKELHSHTSYLNPIFYGLSFGIGALTGAISDKVSLGFIEATEDQVCKHLQEHLQQIPKSDEKTRSILKQMLIDEAKHADMALEQGGVTLPKPVKSVMRILSKAMTATTYHI